MKIFDLFTVEDVKVEDPGLRRYINLTPRIMLRTRGKLETRKKFGRTKINLVERLINILTVPGHREKKHKIMTNRATGKSSKKVKIVIDAFKIVEKQTGQNPIQVLVKAIENSAPRDEVTSIEYGGARYHQAVDTSPSRRLSLALRYLVHGAYDKSFNKKKGIAVALAEEIIAAYQNSKDSKAILKRNESEKQADSAR